jgi:uncharacterized protein YjbI with pentapeptide repeats
MYQCILQRAKCRAASFVRCELTYADFAEADIGEADFAGAKLFRTNLHLVRDDGAVIPNRAITLGTEPELAAAQRWRPKF